MSSEIKLRAWDENLKKMITNENMLSRRFISLNGKTYKIRENLDYSENIIETDIIIMQGTGLKDKNGVEIYCGDIIKTRFYGIKKVADNIQECAIHGFYNNDGSGYEVIGNIYENPELLEEK